MLEWKVTANEVVMEKRKELKIEAKQALEGWNQTFVEINDYPDDMPQGKYDEFINLAIYSSGDIGDVLSRMIQLMQEDDQEAEAEDLIALRGDLRTALKEVLKFRERNSDYTRNQLFANLGDLDGFMDINDLFDQNELADNDILSSSNHSSVEDHLEGEIEFQDFTSINSEITETLDLDDYLFDEEE